MEVERERDEVSVGGRGLEREKRRNLKSRK
jgi:hypothetical protein